MQIASFESSLETSSSYTFDLAVLVHVVARMLEIILLNVNEIFHERRQFVLLTQCLQFLEVLLRHFLVRYLIHFEYFVFFNSILV